MKTFIIISMLISFLGLGTPQHITEYNNLLKKINSNFKKKLGVESCVYAGGLNKNINKVSVGYYANDTLDLNRTRELFIKTSEEVLQIVNNDDRVRPYLFTYPFPIEKIQVCFIFHPTCVGEYEYSTGVINHTAVIIDLMDPQTGIERKVIESYDEAYEKVYGHPRSK